VSVIGALSSGYFDKKQEDFAVKAQMRPRGSEAFRFRQGCLLGK
jgi:hypothetical protein